MVDLSLSEGKVKVLVICFSLFGMIALFFIGSMSEVPSISIAEAGEYDGELVSIRGHIAGVDSVKGDSSVVLLYDSGNMMKAYVEDDLDNDILGSIVTVQGEIFMNDGDPHLTASSADSLDINERNEIYRFDGELREGDSIWTLGIVISSTYGGGGLEITRISPILEEGTSTSPIEVHLMSNSEDPRTGDVVNLTGLISDESNLICFGEGSMEILSRGSPSSMSLNTLLRDMETGMISPILSPVDVQGYLRYEPTKWSFYISDVPEGSSVSIKVSVSSEELHKGDLVSLVNCSLIWENEQMRFYLEAESFELVESYGPWNIGIGDLPYGLSGFEDTMVSIDGHIENVNGTRYITDDVGYLEIRGFEDVPGSTQMTMTGRIRHDSRWNVYFLEDPIEGI
ncbi:MAG: hypothetical protein U9R75_10705 [Candidatus Thermoplasmatota archaeon]|nr:hypothetical protein [Candidatus Thermoplasmatota archaeon]